MSAANFPTIVYRCPGACVGSLGTTFSSVGVDDAEQLEQRLADGWHRTMPEAIDAYLNPQPVVTITLAPQPDPAPIPDDAPPTRDEMMQQAEILGIKPDKRWSDATLMAKINAAMAPTNEDPI